MDVMYFECQMPNCNTTHMPMKIIVPIHTWITEMTPPNDGENDATPVMQTGKK